MKVKVILLEVCVFEIVPKSWGKENGEIRDQKKDREYLDNSAFNVN